MLAGRRRVYFPVLRSEESVSPLGYRLDRVILGIDWIATNALRDSPAEVLCQRRDRSVAHVSHAAGHRGDGLALVKIEDLVAMLVDVENDRVATGALAD